MDDDDDSSSDEDEAKVRQQKVVESRKVIEDLVKVCLFIEINYIFRQADKQRRVE
jgi:hypothetical protein